MSSICSHSLVSSAITEYCISYQHSTITWGHEQGTRKRGKGWQMSRVRHRTEGVAQKGRSSSCVCVGRKRSEIQENQLKEESRPSVTDLKPVRRQNRGKAPLRYRAAEADKDKTTGQQNREINSGLFTLWLVWPGWFPRWQHGCSGGHFDHANQAEKTIPRYVNVGQKQMERQKSNRKLD